MPASTPSTTALPTPTPTPTFSSTPKAAVPPASAVGSVFTHTRPTSRGRVCCVSFRLGRGRALTAAGPRAGACRLRGVGRRCLAPVGKGRCRCAGATLFALRAKALQSGAPDHGVSRERAGFSERFAHQGNLPARRGTGERAAPRRGRRYTPSRRQNAPSPGKTFHIILPPQTRRSTRHASLPVAENLPGTRPRPAFRACLRPIRACLRPIRACLRPIRACLRPIRACLRPIRACLRPIPRLLRLSNACLRTFCTFYAIPRPQKSASHPSRHRLISQTIQQGERRALPAPAQGANLGYHSKCNRKERIGHRKALC